jgi:hypothetical protein
MHTIHAKRCCYFVQKFPQDRSVSEHTELQVSCTHTATKKVKPSPSNNFKNEIHKLQFSLHLSI